MMPQSLPATRTSGSPANGADSPLIVIVGETASGKSALAIELARRFDGEIICADSRTLYRDMDIGTAKPNQAEQAAIRHYGLDLVEPDQPFTVADFQVYAFDAIGDIASRRKLPILVGGSGLYIDAVIYKYQFGAAADAGRRAELNQLSVEQLQRRLQERGIDLPVNVRNPRHLVRALETGGQPAAKSQLRPNTLVLGLQLDREVLRQRINARAEAMLAGGLLAEAKNLAVRYGWDALALQAPAYRAFRGYLEGAKTLAAATADFIHNDMDLAKRQRSWFRRNKSIHWLATEDRLAEAVDSATTFLNK